MKTATLSAPVRRPRFTRAAADQLAAQASTRGSFSPFAALAEVFQGVEWTPSLIAFLYYYFVVITYWLPGADIAIVIALLALVLDLPSLRLGRVLMISGSWVAWAWVSYLNSDKQSVAFPQTWSLTKLWIVTFVAFNVLRTRAQIKFFLAFAVGCFMLFPLRGAFLNYFMGYSTAGRAAWNYAYSNPNDLAGFALIFASLALACAPLTRNRFTRLLAVVCAGLLVLLVFLTQSRGGLLATGVIAVTLVATRLRNPRVVFGTLALVAIGAYFAPQTVWKRLGGLANVSVEGGMRGVDKEGSAEQRFQLMRIAARVAGDHPITGAGAGTYQSIHADYARDLQSEFPLAGGKKDAHNTFLHNAAEMGYVGLFLFLLLCGNSIARGVRVAARIRGHDGEMIRILTYGLVGFLLAGLFGSLDYINVLHLHLLLLESSILALALPPARQAIVSTMRRRRSLAQPVPQLSELPSSKHGP